jgi:hypothetical protein
VTQTTWATVADVLSLAGATVTDTQLTQANGVLELHAGRLYIDAIARTGTRDAEWLRRACAYQAAWMLAQPDMYQRLDITSTGNGAGSVALKDHAFTLAPLAKRALARVSWLRSRSLHVRSAFEDGLGPLSPDPLAEVNDGYEAWEPI